MSSRGTVLRAALGFLELRQAPPEIAPLRRWLDSWTGLGAIVTGMIRQGYDVELMSVGPTRWQATFLEANPQGGAPLAAGYAEQSTPWHAVQKAAWQAVSKRLAFVAAESNPQEYLKG